MENLIRSEERYHGTLMACVLELAQFDQRQYWEMAYQYLFDKIQAGKRGTLTINLRSIRFIPAEGVLVLVNIGRLWHRYCGQATILQQVQHRVLQYLERMNAFSDNETGLIAAESLEPHERWERVEASTNLLELQSIASTEADNARDVIRAVRRARSILTTWLGNQDPRVGRWCTMLSELASNIVHSDDQGFAIIQRYIDKTLPPHGSIITIAIADLGIGIEASLRRRNRSKSEGTLQTGSDYLLHSLQLGVSSRDTIAGTGLYQIKQQILEASGTLIIRSQRSMVTIKDNAHYAQDDLVAVPGTQITLEIRSAIEEKLGSHSQYPMI